MRISDWSSDVCASDLTSHRRENFGGGMENIAAAVSEIAARPDVAVIFPVHPNPNVRRVMDAALAEHGHVAMIDPLDYPHFVRQNGRGSWRERGCQDG